MSDVIWRRVRYMLTPQWDIYDSISKLTKYAKVLEVGFGTGAGVVQYSTNAASVYALEVDPHAVAFAKKMFPLPDVFWMEGDIVEHQGFGMNRFDVVIMIEVLEHIPDWERALREVRKVMAVGGVLIISARNLNADLRRNELHEREWTALEFKDNLSRFFGEVKLVDYQLNPVGTDTHITPLVALAYKTEAGDD